MAKDRSIRLWSRFNFVLDPGLQFADCMTCRCPRVIPERTVIIFAAYVGRIGRL